MLGPNIKIASEKKMRAEAESLAGVDNLKSELVPFTFPVKLSRMEDTRLRLKTFPCAAPWDKIESMLNFKREGA